MDSSVFFESISVFATIFTQIPAAVK